MTPEQNEVGIRPPDYRLPEDAHVGAVRLQVGDLERSLDFYTRVLGFEAQPTGARQVALAAPGNAAPLVELHERRGVRPIPRRGRLGLYHFAVLLPTREALGALVTHLAKARVPLGSADHGVSEALYLSDPDGLGIEVYADRPRAHWETHAGEIAMKSEPLDLRGLARTASTPWSGIPTGTVIGHVHFHIGAIREAESFYHSALGFDKVAWSYPGALFLSAGGYHHHVGTNIWAAGAPLATEADARLLDWDLVLPSTADVHAAAAHASAAGYHTRAAGESRLITDPWGITVRLTQRSNS